MSNEIEIRVTSKDVTDAGFASVDAKVRGMETRTGTSLGRIKEKFKKTGEESGTAFANETTKALEKGLAGAEAKLAGARARLAKAMSLGDVSDKQRASIEYDIKLHESSVKDFSSKLKAEGEKAGKLLAEGAGKEAEGGFKRLASKFTKIGGDVGEGMATGAVKGFSSIGGLLTDNPVLAAVSGALILGLTPLIVTGLGAAIGLALGAGIIGAGIMAAVKTDPSIATAFDGLEARASKTMKSFGKSFAGPVKEGIGILDQALAHIDPAIQRIGVRMGPLVTSIASGIGGMIQSMMPGLEHMANAMAPLFEQLKTDLPEIGAGVGSLLDSIAKAGPGELKFFHDFVNITSSTLAGIGKLIEGMSGVYDGMSRFGDAINNVLNPEKEATSATHELESAQSGMALAAGKAAAAIMDLQNRLVDAGMAVLSMRGAQRGFQAAIDAVSASIKSNGRNLDTNTAKGRANQEVLDAIADSTMRVYKSQQAAHGSQNTLNGTMQRGADASYKAARAMGQTTAQAFAYTKSIYGIPPSKNTLIQALGAAKSAKEIRDLKAEIASLKDKNVNVTTTYTTVERQGPNANGTGHHGGFAHGGIVGGAASGGNRSGRMWVGEAGPELVTLPPGSQVRTAGDSKRMAAEGGHGSEVRIILDARGADDGLLRLLRKMIRVEGGNVQKALGTA